MDLKIPIINGIDTTKIINTRFPDIPVIALTAFTQEIDKKTALAAGCVDYIKKPIDSVYLLQKIDEHIKKS